MELWHLCAARPDLRAQCLFLLQAEDEQNNDLNSGSSWEVEREQGFTFVPREANNFWFYWAADPGEQLHGTAFDWTWNTAATSPASEWKPAAGAIRESVYPSALATFRCRRRLRIELGPGSPISCPPWNTRLIDSGHAVRTNLDSAEGFPKKSVVIPPHSSVEILLDKGEIVSWIFLYSPLTAEEMRSSPSVTPKPYTTRRTKERIVTKSKVGAYSACRTRFCRMAESIVPLSPLWFRTWRYLQILVKTGDASVTLESLATHFSAYPFSGTCVLSFARP